MGNNKLPTKINNEIKIVDKTEKLAVAVQKSQLWRIAHRFMEAVKIWAYWGVSGGFSFSLGLNYLNTSKYSDALGIKSESWPSVIVVGFFIALIFFGIFTTKLIRLNGQGLFSIDKFIDEVFSEDISDTRRGGDKNGKKT